MTVPSPVAVSPAPVWGVIQGYSSYWALAAALEVGLFADLAAGPRSIAGLPGDGRVVQAVVDALAVAGLLHCEDDRVALTEVSAAYLVPGRPRYLGDVVLRGPGPQENWLQLAGTLRTGTPAAPVDGDAAFYGPLVEATYPAQLAAARAVVDRLPTGDVLDLGAGAAPWTQALLERDAARRAVVNDLPEVLPIAHRCLGDLSERCTFAPGDYLEISVAPAAFDVVVLGHVLRGESEERAAALVSRAAGALRPGGVLVVSEYLADDDRCGPPHALLMGLTVAACTSGGAARSRGEVRQWLEGAGFGPPLELSAPPNVDVLIAPRGGEP